MAGSITFALCLAALAQQPPPEVRISPVQYSARGWPIVPDEPARSEIVPEAGPRRGQTPTAEAPVWNSERPPAAPAVEAGDTRRGATPAPSGAVAAGPVASGMELGSPLLDVFQFTRSPGAFKALGGQAIWWRLKVYGPQGEVIGLRELTHTVDCTFSERDRIEYKGDNGRVYGRSGPSVFAERGGMPWPTDAERGGEELQLFGTQARAPWCFADSISYAVLSAGTIDRPGERLKRVLLERRPLQASSLIGPELDPRPRDRFELIFEPATGTPREFVHRFANSGMSRRVLFEDWRDYLGVRIPYRRVYVDETLRQTTTLEILNIAPQQVTERTFRLH